MASQASTSAHRTHTTKGEPQFAARSRPHPRGPRAWLSEHRRVLIGIIAGAVVVGVLVMLWPAVAAPLNADQRYMYLNASGRVQGNWLDIVGIPWSEIDYRARQGRVTPIGYIIQWFFYSFIAEFAVATGTPIVVLHGLQKILLFAVMVACVAFFAKSLRGRDRNGGLVGLSSSTIWIVVAATAVLGAAGMQAHLQFRNGWLTYPVLTYGAVIFGFGVPALALWLTRRMGERPTGWRTTVVVVAMLVTGIFLNVSYELYYAAFPATIVALLVQPSPRGSARKPARLAALTAGTVLTASFITCFLAIRRWTAGKCADDCYAGVDAQLGAHTLETSWYNLASSLPLSGRSELLADISQLGFERLPGPFSSPLTFICVIAIVGLMGVRILAGPPASRQSSRLDEDAVTPRRPGQGGAAVRGAAVALVLGLGSAGIMSVSAQASEIILGIGYPYRHIVVTWVSLCVAGVLCLIAIDVVRPLLGIGAWVAVTAAAILVIGTILPANLVATRAEHLGARSQVVDAIHREVVLGDRTRLGDERRCATLALLREYDVPLGTQRRISTSAFGAYEYFHGAPYCSDPATRPRAS